MATAGWEVQEMAATKGVERMVEVEDEGETGGAAPAPEA